MSKEWSHYTDTELWQAFKDGDEDAFDYMFEKHVRVLYNYGRKFTAASGIIEDCVQDLFVELWEKRKLVSPTNSIKFYLFKSLRLRIIRRLAHENKWETADLNPDVYDFTISFSHELKLISDQLDAEQYKALSVALNSLPKRQKEAIQLKYYDNLSYTEIASIMAITVDSVYKLISGALAALKKHIRPVHFSILWSSILFHIPMLLG